jgi:hypothetical protein
MSALYCDRWIECTADAVLIRGYYFPWGTKRVPYQFIREVRRVPMGPATGRGRVWGSTTLRYWASLDPGRPRKQTALILDSGQHIKPFITPDDPDAVAAVISEHSPARVVDGPAVIP